MANCKPNESILPGSVPAPPVCDVGATTSLWLAGDNNKLEHVDRKDLLQ